MSKETIPSSKAARGNGMSRPTPDDVPTHESQRASRMQPGRDRRKPARKLASFEGKRDNSPVILNYGRNLSPAQKTQIQRRLYLSFIGVVLLAIVGVGIFGILNINVFQPNKAIITVTLDKNNKVDIPQHDYRYMVAYQAQDIWNKIQGANKQQADIEAQIAKDPTQKDALSTQLATVQSQISGYQNSFSQTLIDQTAIDQLTENVLIENGIKYYEGIDPKAKDTLEIPQKSVDDAYKTFGSSFPAGQTLKDFLDKNNISADNLKEMIKVSLRRTALNTYLKTIIVSPLKQVHIERIQYDNQAKANTGHTTLAAATPATIDATWTTVVNSDTIDASAKASGGDSGWIALFDAKQTTAQNVPTAASKSDDAIERWLASNTLAVNTISPVIKGTDGLFYIVRVTEIDNARAIDDADLKTMTDDVTALSHWVRSHKDVPPVVIGAYDPDMYISTSNVPVTPSFNVTFPATPTPGSQQS